MGLILEGLRILIDLQTQIPERDDDYDRRYDFSDVCPIHELHLCNFPLL